MLLHRGRYLGRRRGQHRLECIEVLNVGSDRNVVAAVVRDVSVTLVPEPDSMAAARYALPCSHRSMSATAWVMTILGIPTF